MAVLGETDRDELDAALAADHDAESKVDHARSMASLPDAAVKAWAWEAFLGNQKLSNYELEAVGLGMWQRGQEDLTAPYVERFFEELPGLVRAHHGWVLGDVTESYFPRLSFDPTTLARADELIARDGLDLTIHRKLVDCTDDLRRAVAVRSLG